MPTTSVASTPPELEQLLGTLAAPGRFPNAALERLEQQAGDLAVGPALLALIDQGMHLAYVLAEREHDTAARQLLATLAPQAARLHEGARAAAVGGRRRDTAARRQAQRQGAATPATGVVLPTPNKRTS